MIFLANNLDKILKLSFNCAVFPPNHTIAGIPRWNQRWPPEKRKKGQFGPFFLQGCRLNTAIVF